MIISNELVLLIDKISDEAEDIASRVIKGSIESNAISRLKILCEEFLRNEQIKHLNMLPKQKR